MFIIKPDNHKIFESIDPTTNHELRHYSSLYGNDIGMLYGTPEPHCIREKKHDLFQLTIFPSEDAHIECSWMEDHARKTIELHGPHIFYIAKDTPHSISLLSKTEVFHLYLTEAFIKKYNSQSFSRNVIIKKWWDVIRTNLFMWNVQLGILEECQSKNEKNLHHLLALTTVYAGYLLRMKIFPGNNSDGSSLSPLQIREVVGFVGENFSEKITVADMAEKIKMNKSHFSHMFKRSMGVSPKRYLSSVRLYYCQKLIREGKLSFAEIAAEAGFFDQSHMMRSLKNYCATLEADIFDGLYKG